MLQQQSLMFLHLFRMPPEQIVLLLLGLAALVYGGARLFYTENFFYWCERRKYAQPLEPSRYNLWRMRAVGVLEVLVGGVLAYIGFAIH